MSTPDRPRRGTRWLLALGLVLLAPMGAEYLIGYDTSTGDPAALAAGLLIFGPLYGCPALLIREVARRRGAGWPGILMLGAAFGIIQAGVVDQSLFSTSYRDIPYWDAMLSPTLIGPLGIGGFNTLNFIAGHMLWSFAIPIAMVEALCPPLAGRPWLRWPGLVVTTLFYLAAGLVLVDHLEHEADHATAAQCIGALVVAASLAAFALRRRRRPPSRDAAVPPTGAVLSASFAVAVAFTCMPETWPGVAGGLALLSAAVAAVGRWSRSTRWAPRHVVALATGALVARAAIGFLVEPLGDGPPAAKYAHNVAFVAGSALLGASALARNPAAPGEGDGPRPEGMG